jgi:hypothetical protein
MTQCERIIKYIRDFGSITNREASYELGILNFGARISDLRRQGIILKATPEKSKNRYNEICTYNRYTLA